MLDILFQEDSNYFKNKCIDIGNNRIQESNPSGSRYNGKTSLKPSQVHEIAENIYQVESQSDSETFYMVDMR